MPQEPVGQQIYDWVAIYAAVVSTVVLIWDIVKWRRERPQLIARIEANMVYLNSPGRHLLVELTNRGGKPFTVKQVRFRHYASRFDYWRKTKNYEAGVMVEVTSGEEPPFRLDVGGMQTFTYAQDDEFSVKVRTGCMVALIDHSMSSEPVFVRIRRPITLADTKSL